MGRFGWVTTLGRGIAAAGLGLSVLATGSGTGAAEAAGAVQWRATAGVSTADESVQANAFLPKDLWVNAGDSVTWQVKSGEFHTVSFLSGAPPPPFVVVGPSGPDLNPIAVAPAGGASYGGSGFRNSGLLEQGQAYSLTFTAPGDFGYVCLVHRDMTGTVHVRSAGTPYPRSQSDYDRASKAAGDLLLAQGRVLDARAIAAGAPPGRAVAGIGELLPGTGSLAVMRFEMKPKVVRVGENLTWRNLDPETPHTITFGAEPPGGPFATFEPAGLDRPGHATIGAPGQAVNSGFIGADFPFGTEFSATFTRPGTYAYICALHDELGMKGTVIVVP